MKKSSITNNNNILKDSLSKHCLLSKQNIKRSLECTESTAPTVQPKRIKCDSPAIKHPSSPKKRINIKSNAQEPKPRFIYGNYNRYYGYRNPKDFLDVRLDVFEANKELFANKEILDIGCNSGLITSEIAKRLHIKHITGIDIDKGLINKTIKQISRIKKKSPSNESKGYPFNVSFIHGNYVLRDDVLLEIEQPNFDVILCLSVTKWIHLNFGDNCLKQAFRRMFAQLRSGGCLILEPQPWNGYKRRKKLSPEICKNYQEINFKPQEFTNYLLSSEVGFKSVTLLAVPDKCAEGFRRPIQLFLK